MRRPAESPQEPPALASLGSGRARPCGGVLRHLAARTLGRCSTTLRAAADALTRTRWRLEEPTARQRAVTARHPSTGGTVVPLGYAQGRADVQLNINPAPPPEPVIRWLPRPYR